MTEKRKPRNRARRNGDAPNGDPANAAPQGDDARNARNDAATTRYRLDIAVMPRAALRDPAAETVAAALRRLGFDALSDLRMGRKIELTLAVADAAAAVATARSMARELLVDPVCEDVVLGAPRIVAPDSDDVSASRAAAPESLTPPSPRSP